MPSFPPLVTGGGETTESCRARDGNIIMVQLAGPLEHQYRGMVGGSGMEIFVITLKITRIGYLETGLAS